MKKRKLLNGTKVPELETEVSIILNTKCPMKWVLVDLETGNQYGSTGTKTAVEGNKYLEQKFVAPQVEVIIPK